MVANGDAEHKSLADYASSKQNGKSSGAEYPVNDKNYGFNALGCSDEVHLPDVTAFTSSHLQCCNVQIMCLDDERRPRYQSLRID